MNISVKSTSSWFKLSFFNVLKIFQWVDSIFKYIINLNSNKNTWAEDPESLTPNNPVSVYPWLKAYAEST